MTEELREVIAKLAADEIAVNAYKKFLEGGGRLRYYGYVDKRELKSLCRNFNYTDTRSFIKGGIAASVIILAINYIRKINETKSTEENVETVEAAEENV